MGRGPAWFDISKVVIDDYARKIGPTDLAVYVCILRRRQEEFDYDFEDIATVLGLEDTEVDRAIERLGAIGLLEYRRLTNDDGTPELAFKPVDLTPLYYKGETLEPDEDTKPESPQQQTPKKVQVVCKGFVYIIEGDGYFKIGCTTNLSQRIKALSVKAPFSLIVHLVIPSLDIYTTEKELHQRFARKHRRGEWFDLDLKDLEEIRKNYPLLDPAFLTAD